MNMTPREAFELAEAIVKTWPAGPKQSAWSTFLQERCEHDAAWDNFRQHRDSDERPPSIAGFLATYRHKAEPEPRPVQRPSDGPVMSFAEYLTLLTTKASRGDTDAGQMLDVWQQNLERGAWTP